MPPTHAGHLGAVYDAGSPEEIARLYDGWAATYDAEMAIAGYRHPTIGVALLARHLPAGSTPVLDAGCGTGVAGSWLGILGYPRVEGLDISEGMLAVARARGGYAALHRAALGGKLAFGDGHFAGIIAAGVFTTGHVGAEALPELARITRPGGIMVLTVKTTLWDGSVAAAIDADPRLGIVHRTAPYVSMPGEAATVPSLAVVLART
ncbi:MAG: class I SAM-dependent DNA methyltransferase [Alphaproteobacteria bacterium]|jgi:predicted TPR repeat methyltransferase